MVRGNLSGSFEQEKGQALLIVVLVMVVSLTVGLSLVSRSITNLRTASEEENSQRAFSAAEAGVEQAAKTGRGISTAKQFDNNSVIAQVSISTVRGTEFPLYGGNTILRDDAVTLWLSDYSADPSKIYLNPWSGNLTVYWGSSSDVCDPSVSVNSMAALELVLISGTKTAPVSQHYALDPCNARTAVNNFTYVSGGGGTISGRSYQFKSTIAVTSGLIMRIMPLYSKVQIAVSGNSELPAQGSTIDSVGTSGTTSRKIAFFQGYPEVPSEFSPSVLFSPKP